MKITKTSVCPVCGDRLNISKLSCPSCKAEFPVEENISEYDRLDAAQSDFLRTFLTCRGNMKDVQNKIGISYPTAKKRLDELLKALGIADNNVENRKETVNAAMLERADDNSINASDIIKNKLIDCGGIATVRSVSGNSYVIQANADGNSFTCDELPITPPYEYRVFDVIVSLLFRNGGKARKETDETTDSAMAIVRRTQLSAASQSINISQKVHMPMTQYLYCQRSSIGQESRITSAAISN